MARFLSIEAESTQVRVGEVEISGKKGRMIQCFCVPAPQGAVEDGQIRDTKGLGELLRKKLDERRIKTKKVYFVTGSTRIASREVTIPLVKKNKIRDIIQMNATDYFPIDVSQYVLSYIVLGITGQEIPAKEAGEEKKKEQDKQQIKQYRLLVFAAPRSISAAYSEFAQNAGLNMMGINYTGNTIYQAMHEEYASGTHILIKTEMENTSLSIIRDGKLALQRNINYGVDSAVDAVRSFPQMGERLELQDALELLSQRKYLCSSLDGNMLEKPDVVRQEITESFRYLIGNVSRIMDYYISRNTDVTFDSIVLCGLGGMIQGLPELLTHELGQTVNLLDKTAGYAVPSSGEQEGLFLYIAVVDPVKSGLNLMEKTGRKKKEAKETLSGALIVFGVGAVAAVLLAAGGVGSRIFQEHEQQRLNNRIAEEESIEDVYSAYNSAQAQYSNYQSMYSYTNTPNEGLADFIREMEEKMPSTITVESFSSTGSEVSFTMRVADKSEAANTLIQLRTFDSLASVTTTGIDEGDDGTVNMSVTCTYKDPALLDNAE